MKTVKTEVIGCGNCPFMVSEYDDWAIGDDSCDTCNLTGNVLGSYMGFEEPGYSTPEDCPLKKEDYLITFKR